VSLTSIDTNRYAFILWVIDNLQLIIEFVKYLQYKKHFWLNPYGLAIFQNVYLMLKFAPII
jgi:hypothetical protein